MDEHILREAGLTRGEVKVFLALFKSGSSLASEISRKAGVERSRTYSLLHSLIQKGLASYVIKENRKYFHAAESGKLVDLIQEKRERLQEQEEEMRSFVDELKKLKTNEKIDLDVEVYRGIEGFKTVLNDILKERKDYYLVGYTAKSTELAKYWYAHWNSKRVKLKIKRFLLIPKSVEKKAALKYPLTDVRCLPRQYLSPASASTVIYGTDKVLVFLPMEKDFAGILIKNKEIHASYKDFFDILWKQAK